MKTDDKIILEAMAGRIRELETELAATEVFLDNIHKEYNELELANAEKQDFYASLVLSGCDLDDLFDHVKKYINEKGLGVVSECVFYIDQLFNKATNKHSQEKLTEIDFYLQELAGKNDQ